MLTADQLVDQLASELYHAIVRPDRFRFEDLSDAHRDTYRAGAIAALEWVARTFEPEDGPSPGQVAIEDLLGHPDLEVVRWGTGGVLPDGTTNHPPLEFGPSDPTRVDE
jgi:hypothetical protein